MQRALERIEATLPNPASFARRLLLGALHNFAIRVMDWYAASVVVTFGCVLLTWPKAFETYTFYAFLEQLGTADTWGHLCLGIGAIRLLALFINGTFPGFRFSPHIRFIAAFLTVFVWLQISLGLIVSHQPTTAWAVYPQLLVFDLYNVFLSATEAGIVERRKRYVGS